MSGADTAGHYYLQGVREVGSELLLKPNGTFEYMLAYGAADYWARGTWHPVEGAVILNSDAAKEKPPFGLVKSAPGKAEETRIRLTGQGGQPVPNIDMVLLSGGKDPVEGRSDSAGTAVFPKREGKLSVVFVVRVYSFESQPIDLKPEHNDFTFEINGEAITEVRFKSERLAVDGKALMLKYWGGAQEMRYVKGNP